MSYVDIFDRMKVTLPPGEYDGMRISRFEVVDPDKWGPEHEKRRDVVSPLEVVRMQMEGRAPNPGWYTRLDEHGQVWMSDTTAERRDHAEPVMVMASTHPKRVLINGLGIGMVLTAALSFDSVEHVDVVEKDERVIKLVGPHYLKDPRVTIHHADAVEQMDRWNADDCWDVGWSDIWPTICPDDLPEMSKFTEFYGSRCGFHGNWSEDISKRLVWDGRHSDKTYLKFLTEEDKEQFSEEDEGWEDDDWD
jgi:hypothetical protein